MKTEQIKSASWHGAKMDVGNDITYGDYLRLEQLLSAQHPLSLNHSEMLFIIQHQTSELWMKLMLYELHALCRQIRDDNLLCALKLFSRITRIMEQLIHAWDVLATMTPLEYMALRPHLGTASGFQSCQYRELEFILGNKNAALLTMYRKIPQDYAKLEAVLATPSIYDEAILCMARSGIPVDASRLQQDWRQPVQLNASVQQAWLQVYQAPEKYHLLYELAENLVELESAFRVWRYRHVMTVERIIGFKTGTGGTTGVNYLRKMLDVVLFPELFALRTLL